MVRTSPARRVALVAVVTAVALGVAACGSSPSSGRQSSQAAARAVEQAQTATAQAGSAAVAVTVTSDEHAPGVRSPLSLSLLADFDFGSSEGLATMTIAGLGTTGSVGAMHLIFASSALYLQATGQYADLGAGKQWIELNASSLDNLFAGASATGGGALNALVTTIVADPLTPLGVLDTGTLTAAVVGHPSVDGRPTTEYAVTVRPVQAAAAATGVQRTLFEDLGTRPLDLDVWLDSAGRLVRLTDQSPGPAGSGSSGSGGRITGITVALSQFGTPVVVTVPPAAEVAAPSSSGGAVP